MRLLPIDIVHQEFSRRLRGYDPGEVEEFLAKVGDDYEKVVNENAKLKEELETWQKKVQRYEEMENTMRSAMISAQKASEDIRENAQREAELIRREAQLEKERKLNELSELESRKERFRIEFRTLLETHIKMLD
ncbi:MAG: DivIVA domain-containing protein [bacterium]|nr:DivIVA domain-containing protein [bacterium]